MNAIKNITIGYAERLYKPVGYTMLANFVNIVPFCLSIEAIRTIFYAFDGSGIICWSWLWRNVHLTVPISGVHTK